MKLRELFGYTGEGQTIELMIDRLHIVAMTTTKE